MTIKIGIYKHYSRPRAPGGPREGKAYIPHCGISHGMQGMQKPTVQDIEKINQGGDAPAPVQNRGAPGAQAVRAPYELLEYIRKYINVESMTLKELGDLCLAIEHIIEWAIDNGYGPDDKISDVIETEVEEVE